MAQSREKQPSWGRTLVGAARGIMEEENVLSLPRIVLRLRGSFEKLPPVEAGQVRLRMVLVP